MLGHERSDELTPTSALDAKMCTDTGGCGGLRDERLLDPTFALLQQLASRRTECRRSDLKLCRVAPPFNPPGRALSLIRPISRPALGLRRFSDRCFDQPCNCCESSGLSVVATRIALCRRAGSPERRSLVRIFGDDFHACPFLWFDEHSHGSAAITSSKTTPILLRRRKSCSRRRSLRGVPHLLRTRWRPLSMRARCRSGNRTGCERRSRCKSCWWWRTGTRR